jgi:hypothetical protein
MTSRMASFSSSMPGIFTLPIGRQPQCSPERLKTDRLPEM